MPAPKQMTINLATLQSLIAARDDLGPQKRSEMRSAISTFARVCSRTPAEIIADPATIRGLTDKAPWRRAGLSKRSWANVLSRLTKAMELAGVAVHRRRRNFKLDPAWDDLLEPLTRRQRDEIHRFAGWCSVSGIAPEDVTPATFDRFLSYLEEQMIQRNPRERAHVARRVWNRAIAGSPGSTYPEIPAPEPSGRRLIAWSAVPDALRVEVDAYGARVTSKALFDDHSPIKDVTLVGYLTSLRAYITALVESGVPLDSLTSLNALVEIDLVKRGLQQRLGQRSPEDERARMDLQAVMIALLSVATHLKVDEAHRDELKRVFKRVQHRPNGLSKKNKERLTPLLTRSAIQSLARLPQEVARDLRTVTDATIRQAQRMQMACLVELLLHVPMRIKNVSQLDLAKTIMRPVGGKGSWRIYLPPEDVKNGVPIEATLGEETCALLDRYVAVFRPVLAKGGEPGTALFVGQRGGAKGASPLSRQFSRFVLRECGLTVNAHLMRHLAAHLFLKDNPGCYETVRRLLGHKSIQTTINSYAGTETGDALNLYDALLATLRREGDGGGLEAEDEL